MSTVRTAVRLVILGGLLLSLSLTALHPCIAVGIGRKESISASHLAHRCTCITQDGHRDGSVGCPVHPPKKSKTPRSSMPAHDQDESQNIEQMVTDEVVVLTRVAIHSEIGFSAIDEGRNSLVALHVRLNN